MTPDPLRLAQFVVAIVCSTGEPNQRTHTCQSSKGRTYFSTWNQRSGQASFMYIYFILYLASVHTVAVAKQDCRPSCYSISLL